MPILLKEDESKFLGDKKFVIPQNIYDHMSKLYNQYYGKKEYKSLPGYKTLVSIVNPNYNNKGNDGMTNGNLPMVTFSFLKKYIHDSSKRNKKSLEYNIAGGDEMLNWANNTLNSARHSVEQVKAVPQTAKPKDDTLNVDKSTNTAKVSGVDIKLESFSNKIKTIIK